MKKIKVLFLCVVTSVLLSSCMTAGRLEDDVAAKQLKPEEGKALIYFVRPSKYGWAVEFAVLKNGKSIGLMMAANYLYDMVDPGKYIYTVPAENTEEILVEVKANKTYYIKVMPVTGWITARCKMELMDEVSGRNAIEKCKIAKNFKKP